MCRGGFGNAVSDFLQVFLGVGRSRQNGCTTKCVVLEVNVWTEGGLCSVSVAKELKMWCPSAIGLGIVGMGDVRMKKKILLGA